MRIKKKVNATTSTVAEHSVESEDRSAVGSPYQDAIDYINSAISSLSTIAKSDQLAKESIANLSVVLLDLKAE